MNELRMQFKSGWRAYHKVDVIMRTFPKNSLCCWVCMMQFIKGKKGEILGLGKFMLSLVLIYNVMLAYIPSWRILHVL